MGVEHSILYLDASDEALLNRYKETRRDHPLARRGMISDGIRLERETLSEIKKKATHIIDTSHLLTRQLREKIVEIFVDGGRFDSLMVNIFSFGFKYGIPVESDLVFDARFLPNPFYIPELKKQTGLDEDVRRFVMGQEPSRRFLSGLVEMLDFLIPHYASEGKNQLIVSLGCTGGRHRSVTLSDALWKDLRSRGHSTALHHRDIGKDAARTAPP
jgi:UPF0042 nucleotide-binding protein